MNEREVPPFGTRIKVWRGNKWNQGVVTTPAGGYTDGKEWASVDIGVATISVNLEHHHWRLPGEWEPEVQGWAQAYRHPVLVIAYLAAEGRPWLGVGGADDRLQTFRYDTDELSEWTGPVPEWMGRVQTMPVQP